MSPTAPSRDPGLQPERTALAWQRSALALSAASLVVARLTVGTAGWVAVLVVGVSLGHAALVFTTAHRHDQLRARGGLVSAWPTGVHTTLFALQIALLAGLELATLLRSG